MKSEKANLLHEISDPRFLKKAWDRLNKSNKESKGLNNETIKEFHDNLDKRIAEISLKLRNNKYSFQPVRGVLLQKKEKGKYRPLRIADIGDRLVCKAISIRLDEILTPIFKLNNIASYAYRNEVGISDAIRQIVKYYNEGYKIILEADIIKFFDTVNREKLFTQVFNNLPDSSLNNLINAGISQEVGNLSDFALHAHYFEDSVNGIPQGNALSPLFANIYLSSFDEKMLKADFKLVRYADDFVVLCKTNKDAREAYKLSKKILEDELGLHIHELKKDSDSKTKIADPRYDKFQFLSIRFDGKDLWVDSKKILSLFEKLRMVTEVSSNKNLIVALTRSKNLLEGWLAAFKFVDLERHVNDIDNYFDIQLLHVFRLLEFKIDEKYSREIIHNKRRCRGLSKVQRENTGIRNCMDFLNSIDRNKIISSSIASLK